jgi:hypothetical protein
MRDAPKRSKDTEGAPEREREIERGMERDGEEAKKF